MLLERMFKLVLTLMLIFVCGQGVFAQLGTSGLTGTVKDTTGAVIAGVNITVKNKSTGQVREIVSSEDGRFTVTNLPPALYEMTAEAPNFNKVYIDNVSLRVGETVTLTCVLKPGPISDEVVVVDARDAQGVDTTTQQVTAFINDSVIQNLPLNGRNFIELAFLLPGNVPQPAFDLTKLNTLEVASAGQGGRDGNISIDGAENTDDFVGGNLQNFPQDAVREFQIITNQAAADINRTGSSAINIITKSGTNEYHGSAAFFYRGDDLSALPATLDRNIVKSLGRPPFDREQYALSLGGPIKRDRAWFFSAFEYRDQDSISMTGVRDLSSRTIKNSYSGAPLNDLLFLGRVDVQAAPKDRMTLRYALEDDDFLSNTPALRSNRISTAQHRQKALDTYNSVTYNYVRTFSPTLINDFTVQESLFKNDLKPLSTSLNILFPSVVDGGGALVPQATDQNRFQIRDNVSLLTGAHSIKFGFEFQRVRVDFDTDAGRNGSVFLRENFATRDRNGDGKIDDFDIPLSLSEVVTTAVPKLSSDNNYFGFFIQDNWKIRPNFTLNIGLRYDLNTNSTGKDLFDKLNPIVLPFLAPGGRQMDRDNFGPRIGFNWDIFSNGRTSVHGAYGIYYAHPVLLPLDFEQRFDGRNSLIVDRDGSELDDDGNFVRGTATLQNPFVGDIFPFDFGIYAIDNKFEDPIIQQFNFGIRHELIRDLVITIDGIHTFGNKLGISRDVGEVFNPAIGDVTIVSINEPSAKNWYDALFVNVEKRASKRINFIASYTFSKALNYNTDDQFGGNFPVLDPNNIRGEKGHAIFDERHRFSFAGTFSMPWDITLSPIVTIASALPFNINLPSNLDRIPFAQRNAGGRQFKTGRELNAFISQINAGGGVDGDPLPFVRDDLKLGDGFTTLDLRVAKSIKLTERFSIQAIAEAFNLFNVTNVRTTSTNSSGFLSALVRDSTNPNSPGFLRSSTFGAKRSVVGGVFGTGGPRSFQLAVRMNF
ncbi:MAG: TonB-dependent receptor [Acidobacteriota bacterium]